MKLLRGEQRVMQRIEKGVYIRLLEFNYADFSEMPMFRSRP